MKPEMKNNILLKSALALAIVDLVLIATILMQVNNLVKDVLELQSRQAEIEGVKERLKKTEEAKQSIAIDQTTGWQIYRNEELGLEFKFPQGYEVKLEKELKEFDKGKIRKIYVRQPENSPIMSLYATSKDYAEGVGEGCCFYYADDPIDLKLSNKEILEILNNTFAKTILNTIFDLKEYTLSGRKSLRFFKTDSYSSIWTSDAVLLPYNVSGFTNILITSPSLVTVPLQGGESEEQSRQIVQTIINSVRNSDYLKNEKITKEYAIFKQILSILKFD